ncbi:MAG: N-formylglutamate amidohydrolase [Pseudomonadota bacterium]
MDAITIFAPVERVQSRTDARSDGLLLVCDHASNAVPPWVTPLGLPQEDMTRHIAWDVGARGVTLELARLMGAPAVLSTWSRLVIDPNRGEQDPTLVMKLYDGSLIEGNRHVGASETAERVERLHRPYHAAIDAVLDDAIAKGRPPSLISIHSFTPQLRGRPIRPWHVGLLWDQDDRLVRPLLNRLSTEPGLVVGDNEPYSGQLVGDCMWMHGTSRNVPHVLIEIRNDLIETAEAQTAWAARLAPHIEGALSDMAMGTTEHTTPPKQAARN